MFFGAIANSGRGGGSEAPPLPVGDRVKLSLEGFPDA